MDHGASNHTTESYAYAFKLLLSYASQRLKVSPSDLQLEQIDAAMVVNFLNHLEGTRGNRASSRNGVLSAIVPDLRVVGRYAHEPTILHPEAGSWHAPPDPPFPFASVSYVAA